MRLNTLMLTVCLVALLASSGTVVAQDLDASWLVGKWQGNSQPQGSARPAQIVIQVKADGTFEGEAHSPGLAGVIFQDGKWKIAGDTAMFDYRSDVVTTGGRGGAGRQLTNSTWTLKRTGEDLEGTGLNHSNSAQYGLKFKKAK
jgi:hypothetical protein